MHTPELLLDIVERTLHASRSEWMFLRELKLDPLLDLNMRLGEASGAAVSILLARAALACHAGMATFTEAGVSGAED